VKAERERNYLHTAFIISAIALGTFLCALIASIPFDLAESELFGYEKEPSPAAAKRDKRASLNLLPAARYS
jgi:transcriptional regulator of aromatic amino acid metabolism